MRLRALLFRPVIGACVLALSARAQEATTELRIGLNGNGAPVGGALVALLDAHDSVVAEGLSTESGARVLRAVPGVYRVRVRRIGYLPFVSDPVSVPREGALSLSVESPRVVLERIVINSKSPCSRNDSSAARSGFPESRSLWRAVWRFGHSGSGARAEQPSKRGRINEGLIDDP